ncbi:MAG: alpha/beta hydrolase [Pseudomonadota bacterium]
MSTATSPQTLAQRLQRFAPARVTTPLGEIEFRQAGAGVQGVTHVLLHGIGSGSGSWVMQLEAAAITEGKRVLAWEAPGYGHSSPVLPAVPDASDYAARLWALLDTLLITEPVTLVGHSLGALMAARATVMRPAQVERLILLSPAQGYARASEEERAKKLGDRLNNLNTLGVQGMAQRRGAAMLSPEADAERVAYVQSIMAQVHPAGYTQASHLLVGGDLLTDIAQVTCPIAVASGRADTITPMAGCQQVAEAAGVAWVDLGNAGHACAVDAAAGVNELLALMNQKEKVSA